MIPSSIRFAFIVVLVIVYLPLYLMYTMYGISGLWSGIIGLITLLYLYGELPRHFLSNFPSPTPKPKWLIGHLSQFAQEGYHNFYGRAIKESDDSKVVAVMMGVKPQLVVGDPELIRQIGLTKFDVFHDRPYIFTMRKSKNLIASKGEHWSSSRKALNPTFNSIKLNAFAGIINNHCNTLVQRLDRYVTNQEVKYQQKDKNGNSNGSNGNVTNNQQPIDMLKLFQDLTMDVIGSTNFDAEFKLQEHDLCGCADNENNNHQNEQDNAKEEDNDNPHTALLDACKFIFGDTAGPMGGGGMLQIFVAVVVPFLAPLYKLTYPLLQTDGTRKLWRSIKTLDSTMANILNQKKTASKDDNFSNGSSPKDVQVANFIDLIRKARNPETGIGLDDQEVRDQLNLFVLAGYETTANTLTFTSYLLAQNPHVEQKLVEEIDRLAPKSGSGQELAFKDLADFTYLNNVINEALRLYPPGAMLSRYAEKDVSLQGSNGKEYHIRKGTSIVIPVYSIHRDEDYWENPSEFDPDRFSPEHSEKRPKWAHLPFGIGPRNCIGQRFAMEEAKLALIALYRDYTLKLHPRTEVPLKLRAGITLSPKDGVFLTVHRRQR